jgi:hypothetical protein
MCPAHILVSLLCTLFTFDDDAFGEHAKKSSSRVSSYNFNLILFSTALRPSFLYHFNSFSFHDAAKRREAGGEASMPRCAEQARRPMELFFPRNPKCAHAAVHVF